MAIWVCEINGVEELEKPLIAEEEQGVVSFRS
ncbi:hypothetical protein CCACVL1_05097 [Corchorus capsularis]|uniref:Uncharacterized protein n=1 Tax=Corchorus capsularis TaxID=210143 RepID=A0A1R3JMU8_COCAP|nr:hypothetical protein CCACVL1_05097 [Corchorus capsularis]